MKMRALRDLEIFTRAADAGSLSAAARQLDLTPAAVSAALKRLEAELSCVLMLRSTRSLRLTAEAQLFLDHSREALGLIADARASLASGRSVVSGELQLSVPSDLGRNTLLPWLDAFQGQHPALRLRLMVSDRILDIIRHPVDVALRYGEPPDSSLVALPVAADNRRVLCASPAYLAQHGRPDTPSDLARHNCLCFRVGDQTHDRWRFEHAGQALAIRVAGDRSADDGEVVHRWALAGAGIAYKSHLDIADDLAAGRLVPLCAEWRTEALPLNLVCAD
ncbi:MAG: LysR family transcriptional regulator, partial [Rhodocyclaceae bacterium]|nr:LysR family transcriptional regulator [Rhodocyclaceae bacterium]